MVQPIASYPLSGLQQGMLFHSLSAPRSGVDIEQMLWDLPEAIEPASLRRAWEQLVARHDALRTAFRWEGQAEPVQEVAATVDLPWVQLDWRDKEPSAQAHELEALLTADRIQGFAMECAPLLRVTLIRWGEAHWKLLWTFHHAILDGRSFPLLISEVFALYEVALQGGAPSLPAPKPFREHIAWLGRQDHTAAESFWRETLRGFPAATPLTVDRPPAPAMAESATARTFSRRLTECVLPAESTASLRKFAEDHGVTLGTLVQGAWALLLHRYSGQRDILFGVTRAGRRSASEGSTEAVGLFINTLPLRVSVEPDCLLLDWLKDVRSRWTALRPYEHTPLAQVQGWSEVPAGQSLFESLVVFENYQLEEKLRGLGGAWAARSFELIEQTNLPLTLAAYDGTQLRLKLLHDPARFDLATTARLLGHLVTLITALPGPAVRRVKNLPLITAAEQRETLSRGASRAARYAPADTLVTWFARQVEKTPDRLAVTCEDGGQRAELTYRELDARADRLARRLVQAGVGPDTLVGVFLERTADLVVGILGILKAGGAYVPMEASSPRERLAFMIADSALRLVVTQSSLREKLPGAATLLCVEDLVDSPAGDETALPAPSPENLAYVIYTSGSTGQPKGTLITHHNVVRLFRGAERWFAFGPEDVWTLFHSAAFDFSVWELWGALLYGGRLVVVPWMVSRSPEAFHALLVRERVTVLNQTPSAFRELIHVDAAAPAGTPLALRYVVFGGEALDPRMLAPWFERHGDQRPQLINMYGITETTVHVTYRALSAADLTSGSVIGVPLPDLQLYLLDEDLRPVPIGVPGELYVGGDGLARGYLNRDQLTSERFLPNPFDPGTRLYRTGDRARWLPNYDLEYLGRLDQQVKIRGFRIELGEIEALLAQHPAIRDAVVIARDDGGERRLVGYVVPKDATAPLGDLRAFLQPHLPEYMIPSAFLRLERLPLTENGKLDRRALPAPGPQRPELATPYVAPRTPVEQTLAAEWQEVLRVKQVGIDDNFFELGGNSLRLVQLFGRVGRAFARPVTLPMLFQFPTVRLLAAQLEQPAAPSRASTAQQRAQKQLAALQRHRAALTAQPAA